MEENPFENIDQPEVPERPDFGDGTVVERINKSDMTPLFDANHEHVYIKDEEETDGYYAEVCSKKGCGMGRLVAK